MTDQVYQVNGGYVSRAEYIRHLFVNEDKSRSQIAQELDVPYFAVYSATANMENSHHKRSEGGVVRNRVTITDPTTGEQIPRAEYIRKRILEGASRSQVAKELGTSYSAVWAATKGLGVAGSGGKVIITDPETGEQVPRVEAIRRRFAEGRTRRQIANELGCDYAVVWAATRSLVDKTDEIDPDFNDEEVDDMEAEDVADSDIFPE